MHNIWLIARREYLERVRTKAFLIMTVLIPLLMAPTGGYPFNPIFGAVAQVWNGVNASTVGQAATYCPGITGLTLGDMCHLTTNNEYWSVDGQTNAFALKNGGALIQSQTVPTMGVGAQGVNPVFTVAYVTTSASACTVIAGTLKANWTTCVRFGTGSYSITFTIPYTTTPVCTTGLGTIGNSISTNSSTALVAFGATTLAAVPVDGATIQIICVGS